MIRVKCKSSTCDYLSNENIKLIMHFNINAPIISSRENEHNYGEAGKGGDEQIEKVNNTLPPKLP